MVEGCCLLLGLALVGPQSFLRREEPETAAAVVPGLLDDGEVRHVPMLVERFSLDEVLSAKLADDRFEKLSENFEVDDRTVLNVPRRADRTDLHSLTLRQATTIRSLLFWDVR